jgi:hypothetical protein
MSQKESKGVPVSVNPVLIKNKMGEEDLGLNMRVGHDDIHVEKKIKQVKLA